MLNKNQDKTTNGLRDTPPNAKENENKLKTTKPAAKSTAKPVAKSVAKPAVKRVAKPAVKRVAKPVTNTTAKPIRKTVAKPTLMQESKSSKSKSSKSKSKDVIAIERLTQMRDYKELVKLLGPDSSSAKRLVRTLEYEDQLSLLQIQLIKMQRWVEENNKRVAILFEGRDAAGKGGSIRRFTEHLNPRAIRVVALPKPNDVERGQWYFQRYINQLPNPGEIVFFDRSWYNRAVVEPVMGFCTKKEYERFMQQVPEFEHMLYEDGIILIKFWFSISKDEQLKRFTSRSQNPLKQWKISPVDQRAQELWDSYTHYKEEMFAKTHKSSLYHLLDCVVDRVRPSGSG
jgi:polyphosphate kinase 2